MGSNVWIKSGTVRNMFPDGGYLSSADTDAAAPTGATTGQWIYKDSPHTAYHAIIVGTGAVGCAVTIQFSNDGVNPLDTAAGVITLSGTTTDGDGFIAQNAPWKWHRAVISAPSGTITAIYTIYGV